MKGDEMCGSAELEWVVEGEEGGSGGEEGEVKEGGDAREKGV